MAKYQLALHGFPVGQHLIPVGAIIDDISGTDDWSRLVRAYRAPIPPNAVPLNGPTHEAMCKLYPLHQVRPVPR
jgi:hypothetical protein